MRVIKTFKRVRVVYPSPHVRNVVTHVATVYYHATWQEYFVRFYINGVALHLATRAALSKEDAIATADFWVNRGE